VRQGEANALVSGTGTETFFGRTARLVEEARTVSHFQKAVLHVGDYLIVIALILVLLIIAVAVARGDPIMTTLQFALVLTVAAVPAALPTVLSVTMAVGARLLAARQAIVARLASVEELAGIDVLCSDKTGTLTKNELTLGDPTPCGDVDAGDLLLDAALASRRENADPIDHAILDAVEDPSALDGYEVRRFVPFDPVHKRTEATVAGPDGREFEVTKGAPQVVLALAVDADPVKREMAAAVEELASRGYRALGVARTDAKGEWRFAGVLPLYDPPREDSKATIEAARNLGVDVKMVTGDQVAIGREIARQIGLGTNLLDADRLEDTEAGGPADAGGLIEAADGFAQVYPEHKFRIVGDLQERGHIVGMTGDGVNDAPALKKADVGIAVSGATDAARAAADIVLLSPGLSVIVDAIRESRRIFKRMTSYAIYRIAETIRVLLFMTLSILAFNFYPVTAVMIVLLALLNDGAILSIAYDHVRESDRPDAWKMREVLIVSTALGVLGVIESFGLFFLARTVGHLDESVLQTLMYLKLSVAGHLTIFVARTRKPFWSIAPSRVLLFAVLGTQILATLISVYGVFMTPLGWPLALIVWGYASLWFFLADGVKLVAYRVNDRLTGQA
jgi:H+-transporting ATPase